MHNDLTICEREREREREKEDVKVNALLFPLASIKTANKGNGLQSRAEPLAKITSHKKQVSLPLS